MNREQALAYIAENMESWDNNEGTPFLWYFCADGVLRTHASECGPIGREDWLLAVKTQGLKPRKQWEEQRIKSICEAVIRRAGNGQLPDKTWIEELADLIEGLHDKIGGEMRANQDG